VPLFPDATSLIALGAARLLPLLPTFAGDVYIGRHVRAEVISAAAAIDAGIAAGWLKPETVDDAKVMELQHLTGLDAGECEVIVLAGQLGGRDATLLIDEGSAYETVRRFYPEFELVSLGHALSAFEAAGHITSAADTIAELVANGYYRWAPEVWRDYQRWLGQQRKPGQPT